MDDEPSRARAWQSMLDAAGKYPEQRVSTKARTHTGYASKEDVERRGGARDTFRRTNGHMFDNYRI